MVDLHALSWLSLAMRLISTSASLLGRLLLMELLVLSVVVTRHRCR